jgi:cell division septal protein FtsQ
MKVVSLAGCMVGTSLLLIFAYDFVTQSSYFEAQAITVEGNERVSSDMILKEAGIGLRDNILSVNLHTIRHRVMAHPWIAAAEIERELPDTIHIRVRERIPIAIVELNRPYYLDEEGEIFKPVEFSDVVRVPVVRGLPVSDIDFGDPWRSQLFTAVMEVLNSSRAGQDAIPLRALHRIDVDREMGLTLYASFPSDKLPGASCSERGPDDMPAGRGRIDRHTVAIRVGFGDYESKYERLEDMVSHLSQKSRLLKPVFIDLNDYNRVVVRPSPSGNPGGSPVSEGRGKEV